MAEGGARGMGWRSEVALEAWVEAVVERADPEVVGRAAAEAAALARLHMMTLYTQPPGGVAEGGYSREGSACEGVEGGHSGGALVCPEQSRGRVYSWFKEAWIGARAPVSAPVCEG